jgi:hypothetical protein
MAIARLCWSVGENAPPLLHGWRRTESGEQFALTVGTILSCSRLMPFFALKELARTIGDDNLYELFSCEGAGICRRHPGLHLVRRSRRRSEFACILSLPVFA